MGLDGKFGSIPKRNEQDSRLGRVPSVGQLSGTEQNEGRECYEGPNGDRYERHPGATFEFYRSSPDGKRYPDEEGVMDFVVSLPSFRELEDAAKRGVEGARKFMKSAPDVNAYNNLLNSLASREMRLRSDFGGRRVITHQDQIDALVKQGREGFSLVSGDNKLSIPVNVGTPKPGQALFGQYVDRNGRNANGEIVERFVTHVSPLEAHLPANAPAVNNLGQNSPPSGQGGFTGNTGMGRSEAPEKAASGSDRDSGRTEAEENAERIRVACDKYAHPWWESSNPVVRAAGQISEPILILPSMSSFFSDAERALRELMPGALSGSGTNEMMLVKLQDVVRDGKLPPEVEKEIQVKPGFPLPKHFELGVRKFMRE